MNSSGLVSSITRQGFWLFRWRSYLPIAVIPFVAMAIVEGEQVRSLFGETVSLLWNVSAIVIAFAGLAMRATIVGFVPNGTSGRNTASQIAETLNQTGAYSLCRHPLYFANFVIFTGILMLAQSLWLTLASTLAYWMYYERIICAEEDFLRQKFGEVFRKWSAATPAVFPNLKGWVKPELSFSFRTVLRREYSTMFLIVAAISVLSWVKYIVAGDSPFAHLGTIAFFAIGATLYCAMRTIKRRTDWLRVAGRS